MLDTTTNTPALLPHQVAASAHNRCQAPSGSRPVWCVVATKPKAERTAHAELHRRGFQAYLPLITTRWRDRSWHTRPLFPGYLFVRMRLDLPWNPVRYAPGVYSLLSVDGIPSICPEAAVEALRAGEEARATPTTQNTIYRPGAACEASLGGGSKVEAVVVAINGLKARVLALMFGQMREITVSIEALSPRGDT